MRALGIFQMGPTRDELVQLAKDMWHCIQVTPMAPPALKESIRQRVEEYGIQTKLTQLGGNGPSHFF